MDVVFEIYEGENTIINSITFNGNQEFSDRRLRDIIITRQTRWYSILSSMTSEIFLSKPCFNMIVVPAVTNMFFCNYCNKMDLAPN